MTTWSDARLRQLFERYRLRYWQRSRRLKQYRIENRSLADQQIVGLCEFDKHLLTIDVAAHTSDREVRATVLHEMIHAVISKSNGGHHAPFWTQLEYLLKCGAPVTIGFPELAERGTLLQVIPRRFRRCRQLFRPAHLRYQRHLNHREGDRVIPAAKLLTIVSQEAEDAAMDGATWRAYWRRCGAELSVVDLDGRTLPSGKQLRNAARHGWLLGRRQYLEEQRLRPKVAAG